MVKKVQKNKKDLEVVDVLSDLKNEKEVLLTKDGLKAMKEELEYLKTDGRKKVSERLKEAISFGDLSENSEYEEAKNEQGFIEGRISELEIKIKNAKIIKDTGTKVVSLGSKVTLVNLTKKGEEVVYTLVGSTEADPFNGKISNESPVGIALIDKAKNEKVKVLAPGGVVEYHIIKID
jgi:transcription elongation factor GreA